MHPGAPSFDGLQRSLVVRVLRREAWEHMLGTDPCQKHQGFVITRLSLNNSSLCPLHLPARYPSNWRP